MYRQCAWHKYGKVIELGDPWERASTTSCHVNTTHPKYYLLDFKDNSIKFEDATNINDK